MPVPQWVDRREYPFTGRYFQTGAGAMHYLDEGRGKPVVMIHGNPTWSFLYRHLIKGLSGSRRCIAPDHLGFGLSEKPGDFSYFPEDHAKNLAALLDSLDLSNITLVVQDWGGPIGLSYALANPHRIERLVIMNTWMWPVAGDRHFENFSAFMGGALGGFLIRRFNFFVNVVMKKGFGNVRLLTPEIHRHYKMALPDAAVRKGCAVFPQRIIASGPWLGELWEKRERIRHLPTLIVWGMKDIAFRKKELERFKSMFNDYELHTLPETGHWPQEEAHGETCRLVQQFLEGR